MTGAHAEAEARLRGAIRGLPGQCLLDGLLWPWMQLTPRSPRHMYGPWPTAADVSAAFALVDEAISEPLIEALAQAEERALPTEVERQRFETRWREHELGWRLPPTADLSVHISVDEAWRRIDPTGRLGLPGGLLSSVRWWPGRDAHADPAGLGGPARASLDDPDRWPREVLRELGRLVDASPPPDPPHWMIAATDYRVRRDHWQAAISEAAASLRTPAGRCLLATVVAAVAAGSEGAPADVRPRLPAAAGAIRAAFARLDDPLEEHVLASLLAAEPGAHPGAIVRTPDAVVEELDGMWGPAERPKPPLSWRLPSGTDTSSYDAAWAAREDPANDVPTDLDDAAGADWLLAATDRRVRMRLTAHRSAPPAGGAKRRSGWRRLLTLGE